MKVNTNHLPDQGRGDATEESMAKTISDRDV